MIERRLKKNHAYNTYRRKRDEDGRLVYHHDWVWEKVHHKRIPKGHVIHHIDGNCRNNHPGNLACVTISKNTALSDPASYHPANRRKR